MEWHKDSAPETKNADGTPKVFYHGTMSKKSFTEFNTENSPSWFTPNKSYAGAFAPVGGNIFEVYLHVKKPMWVGDIDGIINDVSLKRLSDNWNQFKQIEVNTIDGYQGKENELIIVSLVKSELDEIGFIENKKRFNVMITRAKRMLIIVGNFKALSNKDDLYKEFIDQIRLEGYNMKQSVRNRCQTEIHGRRSDTEIPIP